MSAASTASSSPGATARSPGRGPCPRGRRAGLLDAATGRARRQGVDTLDLQDWLGHEDPRTTRNYIRDGEKPYRSPAYVLRY
jgi:hypothetical protein